MTEEKKQNAVLRETAERLHVKVRRDEDGEFVIPGRRAHCHIYDPYKPGHLGLCLMEKRVVTGGVERWISISGHLKSHVKRDHPDWLLMQEGAVEATFYFPATDENTAAALKYIRPFRHRQLSPEQREKLVEGGRRFQTAKGQKVGSVPQFSTTDPVKVQRDPQNAQNENQGVPGIPTPRA